MDDFFENSFMDTSMDSMDISTSMEESKMDPPLRESSISDIGLKLEKNINQMIEDFVFDTAVKEVKQQRPRRI